VSLLQGLFIPAVTTLYFAGALQAEGNHEGFIFYYNGRSFAYFVALISRAQEKYGGKH
jgi:hypothetical protein